MLSPVSPVPMAAVAEISGPALLVGVPHDTGTRAKGRIVHPTNDLGQAIVQASTGGGR